MVNGDYFSWRYMWPRLAAYFGVKAGSDQKFSKASPQEGELQLDRSFLEWSADKRQVWGMIFCDKNNNPIGEGYFRLRDMGFPGLGVPALGERDSEYE